MDLKEFVKNVLIDVDAAVAEASGQITRDIRFANNKDGRTIEFDIAVTAEDTMVGSGKAGVRVLSFAEAGGNMTKEKKSSNVSRIVFGLNYGYRSKEEEEKYRREEELYESQHQPGIIDPYTRF